MLQGVPTLFPNGVSNAAIDSFGAKVPMLWPPQYYSWFTDFDRFSGVLTTGAADWLVLGAGAVLPVVSDAFGGVLTVTTGATDDNATVAQWHAGNATTDVAETFTFVAGKEAWFGARFQLADVLQSDFAIGLAVAGATTISIADGVWFGKTDGSAVLSLNSAIATPLTASVNVATLVNATYVEAAYHYNGIDTIAAYINNSFAGSIGITALPTTELAFTFALQAGEAVAKSALIDWMFAARER